MILDSFRQVPVIKVNSTDYIRLEKDRWLDDNGNILTETERDMYEEIYQDCLPLIDSNRKMYEEGKQDGIQGVLDSIKRYINSLDWECEE